MCKCIPLGVLLLIVLQLILCCLAKSFRPSYKNIRKLPKSEVDVKALLFPCSISEEPFSNSTIGSNYNGLNNCSRKLIIMMTVNSGGEYCTESDGFIPIDHVVDGITGRKKRLLNPIMVRIKKEGMYQLYDLQLVKSVNAEAREEVFQYDNTANFSGCDTSSSHPTCGYSFFKNKIIQFSEGFCCSCDQAINEQRQPCDGRPGERKYPTDMKLAVRDHRSKLTFTGLDTDENKIHFPDNVSEHEKHKLTIRMKRNLDGKNNTSDEKSFNLDNNTSTIKLLTVNNKLEAHETNEYSTSTESFKSGSKCVGNFNKKCESTIKKSASKKTNITCSVGKPNRNLTSLERIVYEIVPILNNADPGDDSENKNINIVFNDVENTTRTLSNVQLKEAKLEPGAMLPHDIMMQLEKEDTLEAFNGLPDNILQTTPNLLKNNSHIEKRETCERQVRGGQKCSGKEVPCFAKPETYFESAHCLRFSDLWYSVHKVTNPKIEDHVTVKIYAKHKRSHRKACWENLTKHVPGRVGTVSEVLTDEKRSILIKYSSDDNVAYSLDVSNDFLLVPQPLSERCNIAELQAVGCGGPREYLVLKEHEISFDGDECDRAGVTYAAFARQSHRCESEAGSCLRNQPLQLWREDKEAEAEGKRGQYFLSNFITVTDQPILLNTTSNKVVLRAPYYEHHRIQIVVELNADHIEIIADRSEGQITEVYVDATKENTVVSAVVTNMGIAADLFGIDLVNCTHPLGPTEFDKRGKVEIPPQHRRTFTATVSVPLRFQETSCQLAVYGVDKDVVASRKVLFVRGERCVCLWHCRCVCLNYPRPGLLCTPLTQKEYNRAGFPGHLPGDASGTNCAMLFTVLQALLFFFLFLLLFGLVKAVLGLCFPNIAAWKLWHIMPDEARCHRYYFQPELDHCNGYPGNPYSFRRTVRFLPWCTEFIVNIFFFILVAVRCVYNWLSGRTLFANKFYAEGRSSPWKCGANSPCAPRSPCDARSPCARSPLPNVRGGHLTAGGAVGNPHNPQCYRDYGCLKAKQALSSVYLKHR